MKFSWPIVAIFAGRFFATAVYYPQGDGDLGWQRWLGARIWATLVLPQRLGAETFTAQGARWVPQEWLFSVLAYRMGSAGWMLFAGFCALCAASALALVARAAERRGAHPYATALCTALAGIALLESFGVRVQTMAWPLLAAYLILLESDGPVAYYAIAVAALWSNVHASVVLAPVIAGVVLIGNWLDRGWDVRARRTAVVAACSALATCANPLGYKIPLYAFALFTSPFKSMIIEWHRTTLGDISFAAGALPLLLCALVFGLNGPQRWRDRIVLVLFAWLMFSAARNVALFALAGAPLAARALTFGFPFLRERVDTVLRARSQRFAFLEVVVAFALAGAIGVFAVRDQRAHPIPATQPQAALAAIAALPGPRNVLCADFAWCSFLLSSPRARVFLDGRADPYPQRVWNDFATIVRLQQNWQQTLRRRDVDVVLVSRTAPLEQALLLAREWRSVYVDRDFRVWARDARAAPRKVARRYVRIDMSSRMPTSVNAAM